MAEIKVYFPTPTIAQGGLKKKFLLAGTAKLDGGRIPKSAAVVTPTALPHGVTLDSKLLLVSLDHDRGHPDRARYRFICLVEFTNLSAVFECKLVARIQDDRGSYVESSPIRARVNGIVAELVATFAHPPTDPYTLETDEKQYFFVCGGSDSDLAFVPKLGTAPGTVISADAYDWIDLDNVWWAEFIGLHGRISGSQTLTVTNASGPSPTTVVI